MSSYCADRYVRSVYFCFTFSYCLLNFEVEIIFLEYQFPQLSTKTIWYCLQPNRSFVRLMNHLDNQFGKINTSVSFFHGII